MSEEFERRFREAEQARMVEEGMTPEELLGLPNHFSAEELEEAYVNRRQTLMDELMAGQKGDGSRVVPSGEYEQRIAQIESAYHELKAIFGEDEVPTQELDPNFPKRMMQ